MSRTSPLLPLHERAGALIDPYGPLEAAIRVVQTFAHVDMEYAALRRAAVLIDSPQRALLALTGPDRLDFLGRMLTQEMKKFDPWTLRNSFWLSRKGRIDADLAVIHTPNATYLDLDAHAAARTVEGLSAYIIADDVKITDETETTHRLSLHGPAAPALLTANAKPLDGAPAIADLKPRQAGRYEIAGAPCRLWRTDPTGEPGYEINAPLTAVTAIYQALSDEPDPGDPARAGRALERLGQQHSAKATRAGWAAFNIARIEAGTPFYYLDFGPNSLPAESGVLSDRVSFTKGCYLGQEIVARMNALGKPKQQLTALRLTDPKSDPTRADPAQPQTGSAVYNEAPAPAGTPEDPIGAITSSCISPMLGGLPIAFSMLKHAHTAPGTKVRVEAEGTLLHGEVQPTLTFWKRA